MQALPIPDGPSHSRACVVRAICSDTELLIAGQEPCCNTSVSYFRVFIKALHIAVLNKSLIIILIIKRGFRLDSLTKIKMSVC